MDFVFAYLDDVLIFSSSREEHIRHLETLFKRFQEYGLAINRTKCQFGKSLIEFLGYQILRDGILPLPDKVNIVQNFPKPDTAQALREFIGLVNFYHRFIPNASRILRPLFMTLNTQSKSIIWNNEKLAYIRRSQDNTD
uniref:Transposon Ty3-G Gag-Pol polyprotein (Trinotate prediction) n=1 Tax=Henneguya salminicola TaxID=69463 RepID=A0A6G3MFM4_HENSL